MSTLKKVSVYLPHYKPINTPPLQYVVTSLCLYFPVVLFKFSPCSALVIKSFKHKAGSMGSVYSFPKSIILHINHWSGTFGQCWICYLFFFPPLFSCFTPSLTVHRFQAVLILDGLFIWLSILCPLKKLTIWHL